MPRIQITLPQEGPQKFSLQDDLLAPLSIGRSEECDMCLSDASLSDVHASLAMSDGNYYLVDQHSTNGIRLNGVLVDQVLLIPNEAVFLGEVSFVLLPPKESEVPVPVMQQPAPPVPNYQDMNYPTAHFPHNVNAAPAASPFAGAPALAGAPAQFVPPAAAIAQAEPAPQGGFKRGLMMVIYLVIIAVLACFAGATYRHYEMTGEFLPMQLLNMDAAGDKVVPAAK